MPPARADAVKERVRANARLVDGLGPDRHRSANLPCAFLEQGRCTAYELRPSICASFHSMSKARCAYAFEHPRDMATPRNSRPVVLELQVFADTLVEAARTALRGAGLACENLELHQAVRAVLDDPEAMNRWRAGGSLATGTSVEVQQQ
jgi:Fe-S-cluster containining protein